jgi:hypothetical protein
VNILDEQVLESQRQLLRSWRIPIRQIGHDIGRKGMKDQEIIPLGKVMCLSHIDILVWSLHVEQQRHVQWIA